MVEKIDKDTAEFVLGMQNIEIDIIDLLKAVGYAVTHDNFRWTPPSWVPPPENMLLTATLDGKLAQTQFDKEQLQDSWFTVERHDVLRQIDWMIRELTTP